MLQVIESLSMLAWLMIRVNMLIVIQNLSMFGLVHDKG